jgi:pimeloyl-ACP methyl ester carboxylesterase
VTRLRRSRVLPRILWLATRAAAPLSTTVAGYGASLLWFVPWQRSASEAATWPPDVRHHRTTIAGHPADLHEVGTGPTVLLVHGWSDDAGAFRPMVDAFTRSGWRVVAVDLPAHGDVPGLRTDLPMQAAVVGALIAREEPSVVVAHSLGAAATALALREHRSGVRGVVLLAPAVRLGSAVRRFLEEVRLPDSVEAGLRRRIERRFGPDIWTDTATDRNLAATGLPGLVIHDVGDRRAPIEEARTLVRAWPGGELHTTRGLGHRRLLADPTVVTRVVAAATDALAEPERRSAS